MNGTVSTKGSKKQSPHVSHHEGPLSQGFWSLVSLIIIEFSAIFETAFIYPTL
jgi:hypothetical protein